MAQSLGSGVSNLAVLGVPNSRTAAAGTLWGPCCELAGDKGRVWGLQGDVAWSSHTGPRVCWHLRVTWECAGAPVSVTDGLSSFPVHFRYVVFHPFLDEILIGKIKGCSPEGVHVSLGFFDDILIPPESLQQPAKFDEAEQVWVWEYETEEGAHDLYMDTGEEIRFRVVDESFVDTSPTGPSSADATTSSEELPKKEAPYTLVVSFTAVMDPTVAVAVGPPLTLTEKTLPGP
uniref:DNA-directed RNA polymerase III subunit RPC8 isoform X1 n=1 Tax=Macaca mulatta TaxID=9544 RepID=UPI0010A2209F|nr:DNA-directed RNA polymerase III subunit RPC8 isoform X1 [Macaca mulatta]